MRIAFDQQIFSWQEYGGISRYVCSLASHLSEIPGVEAKIFAPLHVNSYLPQLNEDVRTGIKVKKFPKTARMRISASRLIAMPLLKAFHPEIVHETYYALSAYAPRGAYRVLTAYDLIHERFSRIMPANDPTLHHKASAFSRADHIICISESTRNDLMELYDIPDKKVSVTYLGFDALPVGISKLDNTKNKPYLLYVGQRHEYKNFIGFVKAYTSSAWIKNNFRLLCFGGGDFTSVEKEMFAINGLKESHIMQISGNDRVLADCYREATVFVYPSLYEGFGIPPLEAMSLGCPVVCSNTSSIPEVVGNAGEYFDPASIDSMRESIERVLQSSERRSDLTAKGFVRCKSFTWKKCAAETLAIYKSL